MGSSICAAAAFVAAAGCVTLHLHARIHNRRKDAQVC